MNARITTLLIAVSTVALTGCSGGFGNNLLGRGAPCGPACSPAAGPAYDIAPGCNGGGCNSGYGAYEGGYSNGYGNNCDCCNAGESYAGYGSGVIHDGLPSGAVQNPGYNDGWVPGNQYVPPQPGEYIPGQGTVVQPGTNMMPAPAPARGA